MKINLPDLVYSLTNVFRGNASRDVTPQTKFSFVIKQNLLVKFLQNPGKLQLYMLEQTTFRMITFVKLAKIILILKILQQIKVSKNQRTDFRLTKFEQVCQACTSRVPRNISAQKIQREFVSLFF